MKDVEPELGMGDKLKALRLRAGKSIRDACTAVGMKTPSAWKHYEDDNTRDHIPADMVVELLRAWEGEGDPAISTEEILGLSPNLMELFKVTGHHFNTSVNVERSNIKLDLRMQARSMEDVRSFMRNWAQFMEADED